MKRIFSMVAVMFLTAMMLCAQQEQNPGWRVLYDASTPATYETRSGDSVINNAENMSLNLSGAAKVSDKDTCEVKEVSGKSGTYIGIKLHSSLYNDNAIYAEIVPIIYANLTENESGNGLITNVSTIRKIRYTFVSNGYDIELGVKLSRSNGEPIQVGTIKTNTEYVGKQAQFVVEWENPNPKNPVASYVSYPQKSSDLNLDAIRIRANIQDEYAFIYLQKIEVLADLATLEQDKDIDDENIWGESGKDKNALVARQDIKIDRVIQAKKQSEALMAKDEKSENSGTDAK